MSTARQTNRGFQISDSTFQIGIAAGRRMTEGGGGGRPDEPTFLLSATEIDKRRSFFLNLKKLAKIEIHDALDTSKSGWEEEAAMRIEQAAGERGLKFQPEALELFTLCTGGDRRNIASELEKL